MPAARRSTPPTRAGSCTGTSSPELCSMPTTACTWPTSGSARATGMDSMTVAGTVVGTAGYLSPSRRWRARRPASDRYALGVVAFELLTGERPFTGHDRSGSRRHVPSRCRRPERNPRSRPRSTAASFRKAMAKDPSERFESNPRSSRPPWRLTERERTTRFAPPPRRVRPARPSVAASRRIPAIVACPPPRDLRRAARQGARGGDGETSPTRSVVTQVTTQEGERVTVTETVEPPPPPPPPTTSPPPPAPPASGGGSGRQLTDRSTRLMREGRFEEALPVAQQALADLQGSGELYEAYANYKRRPLADRARPLRRGAALHRRLGGDPGLAGRVPGGPREVR